MSLKVQKVNKVKSSVGLPARDHQGKSLWLGILFAVAIAAFGVSPRLAHSSDFEEVLKAAEQGDVFAQYDLGNI